MIYRERRETRSKKDVMRYIYEQQFCLEMGVVEPNSRDQCRLMEIIEEACRNRSRLAEGYSVARIVWKRKLMVWYQAVEGEITLMSIRPD